MFGQNPVRKQELREDGQLRVQEIFKTIQGEGPFAGQAAIFIRLAGCNLRCFFCDTDFESGYGNLIPPEEIMEKVSYLAFDTAVSLIVITGGEPLLQNCIPLLYHILTYDQHRQWRIQFETAGTVWLPELEELMDKWPNRISLVCSPKTGLVHRKVAEMCKNWKYIIRAGETAVATGLPVYSTQIPRQLTSLYVPLPRSDLTIYVQPCDEGDAEKNRANTDEAVSSAVKFGYTLCLQLHKLVGLP